MSKIILIAVPEDATAEQWTEVHKALSTIVGAQVVESAAPKGQSSSKGRGLVKGSDEAKDVMASVRAAKASKASGASKAAPPKGESKGQAESASARLARIMAGSSAEVAAESDDDDDAPNLSNVYASDLSDNALKALADWTLDTLKAEAKQVAMVRFLEGKCPLSDLESIAMRGGSNLAKQAYKQVAKADA